MIVLGDGSLLWSCHGAYRGRPPSSSTILDCKLPHVFTTKLLSTTNREHYSLFNRIKNHFHVLKRTLLADTQKTTFVPQFSVQNYGPDKKVIS